MLGFSLNRLNRAVHVYRYLGIDSTETKERAEMNKEWRKEEGPFPTLGAA